MAEAIVSFGVEKLWEFVSQEYERLQGVGEQITELKSDLNMLMSFLNDADEKKQTSALARNCVEEVKEITYDAEDIIQTFILKAKQRNGIKNQMRSLACIQGGRRKTALEITSISKRISKVIHVMQTFNIKSDIMNSGLSQALMDKERETRHTFPIESESNLVGLEKNVEKLVEELVGDDSSHGVSITGLGGLGKTTLARQVFNHGRVKGHFDGLAWVCVSQDFTRKDVWETILKNLSHGDYVADMKEDKLQKSRSTTDDVSYMNKSQRKKISDMNEDELQEKLNQLLETKKVLIVFDDVWKRKDWDTIKPMFPERKAGWKVLLTSRNNDVHPHCVTFKPELLTHDECWKLLQMKVFPMNDTTGYIIDEEMVKMAEEMVKHCGRLPLAAKVLGGLLAAQHTPRQWKIISENIKPHIVGGIDNDSSSVNHVLSLSFEGLPSYLKHCLLHLASYPEDYRISLEDVSYIWAAEGITKPRHYEGATIRDVSDVYIEELVKRNMVISERDMVTSRFEVCQLHDLMREICLLKAKEECFLQIVTDPACSSSVHSEASSRSRRLVVYIATTERAERVIKNSKLRSLLFFPVDEVARFFMGSYFMELQLLRVLDLTRANFKGWKVPSTIGKLIHLKYLSLYKAYVAHLPSSIRNLKSLLYLNLGLGYGDCHVPNVLKEMQELRYLCLPRFTHKKTKLELGGLLKLETLRNFSTKDSSVTDFHHMTRLRNLSISIDGCSVEMLSSTLSKLSRHLENLTIEDHTNGRKEIHMPRLPNVHHFPSHLTTIYLKDFRLEEDPMPILEKLLQLKEVKLLNSSFRLRRMVCSGGGFPKLLKLEIFRLWEWEEWIVEEGSMPLLHTLNISECHKLKELPDRLRFITSLKELTIHTSEREFRNKVSKGGEDYYKIQHIPLIRYNWQPASEDKEV
ncbi:NB-ARC, partial [Arabidopsis thaliana x Arabidopsis arenosa]